MQAVVYVDAAPGYEDSIEASLRKIDGVARLARFKSGNNDLAVLVEVDDASGLDRIINNDLRRLNGVKAVEHVSDPNEQVRNLLGI